MALVTAGEKGDRAAAVTPGETAFVGNAPVAEPRTESVGFVGMIKVGGFVDVSVVASVDFDSDTAEVSASNDMVEDVHGGAGNCVGVCEVPGEISALGASGIASNFGVEGFVAATVSTSFISTSFEGAVTGSSTGVVSFDFVIGAVSVDMSIATGSSRGAAGAVGEGLLEVTSFKAGEFISSFTDADRMRSLCVFSSCACCSNLRLKDIGGRIGLMTNAGVSASIVSLPPSVCVELSTYTGLGFCSKRPFALAEPPEAFRATP
jgi:hypothetical protein